MALVDKISIDSASYDIAGNSPVVSQSDTTASINPNELNEWSDAVTELTITLNTSMEISGKENEYMMQFTVSGTSFTLTFSGSTIVYNADPTWDDGKTYQVSIVNGYALVASFRE